MTIFAELKAAKAEVEQLRSKLAANAKAAATAATAANHPPTHIQQTIALAEARRLARISGQPLAEGGVRRTGLPSASNAPVVNRAALTPETSMTEFDRRVFALQHQLEHEDDPRGRYILAQKISNARRGIY